MFLYILIFRVFLKGEGRTDGSEQNGSEHNFRLCLNCVGYTALNAKYLGLISSHYPKIHLGA